MPTHSHIRPEDIRDRLRRGDPVSFEHYVAMARQEASLKQVDLSLRLKRGSRFMVALESGRYSSRCLPQELLRELADALGLNGDALCVLSRLRTFTLAESWSLLYPQTPEEFKIRTLLAEGISNPEEDLSRMIRLLTEAYKREPKSMPDR